MMGSLIRNLFFNKNSELHFDINKPEQMLGLILYINACEVRNINNELS